jgi:hypothetical protein
MLKMSSKIDPFHQIQLRIQKSPKPISENDQ